jgi:hypothetical protein
MHDPVAAQRRQQRLRSGNGRRALRTVANIGRRPALDGPLSECRRAFGGRLGEGRVARWQEVVKTKGKATTMDAGMVEERAQMALEAAARTNIEEGFKRLGRTAHAGASMAPTAPAAAAAGDGAASDPESAATPRN